MSLFYKLDMQKYEFFNSSKLQFILDNEEFYKKKLNLPEDDTSFEIYKKYLSLSINDKIEVNYYRINKKGRLFANGSLSLQSMKREIRHTIANEYYVDIDIENCHFVSLLYYCKKNNIKCPELYDYVVNRDEKLKLTCLTREKAKQLYCMILNNGKVKKMPSVLNDFKYEIEEIYESIINNNNEDYKKFEIEYKNNKKYNGKDNPKGSYINNILCDIENKILMDIYEYFKAPDNVVFCFDGLMLDNKKEYDIEGCINYIRNKYNLNVFNLKIKPMNEGFNLTYAKLKPYKSIKLNYFDDYVNLLNRELSEQILKEYFNNCIFYIDNGGKHFYITKNKKKYIDIDKSTLYYNDYKIIKKTDLLDCLDVNIHQTGLYYNLGRNKGGKSPLLGYLQENTRKRKIKHYKDIDYYPHLKKNKCLLDSRTFNLFTPYPYDNDDYKGGFDFTKSRIYNHFKNDFFNNDLGELHHYLAFIADMIQDPARIKGTSHLFYSEQGCGKGLNAKFLQKLLGILNVAIIIDTDNYFSTTFNNDTSQKILKVFEEVSDKGNAFKYHNRLKAELTSDTERVEPKGVDAYTVKNYARHIYNTNNENTLYIENDDRRHTLHKISNIHKNDYEYFEPIWKEISDNNFMKSAFDFFSNYEYDERTVMTAYKTSFKKEQKNINLPLGIKFIIDLIKNNDDYDFYIENINKDYRIPISEFKQLYKIFCSSMSSSNKYNYTTLKTQLKKINITTKRYRIDGKLQTQYNINPHVINETLKNYLQNPEFEIETFED